MPSSAPFLVPEDEECTDSPESLDNGGTRRR
jgi:hypothetical protein